MHNPWISLPRRPPFVLPEDAPYIATFNHSASKAVFVETGLMPAPFLGAPTSPIVVLALNPGVSPLDFLQHRSTLARRRVRDGLAHRIEVRPFTPLSGDPMRPGARWWRRNLKALLKEVDEDYLAHNLCCLEYFPYHSRSFGHAELRLPSQAYTFALLRSAMKRKAIVVLTRGARLWFGAVPELATYRGLVRTKNARSASISPKNCPDGFSTIVRRLRRAAI